LNCNKERITMIENVEVFKTLQLYSIFGDFFIIFGCDLGIGCVNASCELEMEEKFAENLQVEFFHAHVTWRNEKHLKKKNELILKVFKKGTFLRQLQF
jgi:hypothetical protein